jgi:hypothetical protein
MISEPSLDDRTAQPHVAIRHKVTMRAAPDIECSTGHRQPGANLQNARRLLAVPCCCGTALRTRQSPRSSVTHEASTATEGELT